MSQIEVGRLLRSNILGFTAGCNLHQFSIPKFGGLVRASLVDQQQVYGVITNIRIVDDALFRQVARTALINPAVQADQRMNRMIPVELTILSVGFRERNGQIRHQLPPRPPLSLESLYQCDAPEILDFISIGQEYLGYLLQSTETPPIDLLISHLSLVKVVAQNAGKPEWVRDALRFLQRQLQQNSPDQYVRLATAVTR